MGHEDIEQGPLLRPGAAASPWPLVPGSGGRPVPDLRRIPRSRWEDALRVTHPIARRQAASSVAELRDVGYVLAMAARLELEDAERDAHIADRASERIAHPMALPAPTRPEIRRTAMKQVSFRLTADAYADLARAARIIDSSPGTLARLLTVRGARGLLLESEPG